MNIEAEKLVHQLKKLHPTVWTALTGRKDSVLFIKEAQNHIEAAIAAIRKCADRS